MTQRGPMRSDRLPAIPRGDLIAYLTEALDKRAEMAAMLTLNLSQFFAEGAGTPLQLLREILGARAQAADEIFDRAVERGEVDSARLTPRVRALPFDVLRGQMMMTMGPCPRRRSSALWTRSCCR